MTTPEQAQVHDQYQALLELRPHSQPTDDQQALIDRMMTDFDIKLVALAVVASRASTAPVGIFFRGKIYLWVKSAGNLAYAAGLGGDLGLDLKTTAYAMGKVPGVTFLVAAQRLIDALKATHPDLLDFPAEITALKVSEMPSHDMGVKAIATSGYIQHEGAEQPTAHGILAKASRHMQDRAKTYDTAGGERSMGKTVAAFNTVTGHNLTEAEGWLLMTILKQVRLFSAPGYHPDSAEDLVAYAALLAEGKSKEVT